ncbi:hypothetical protein CGCFRS4_v012215 [Colletotrichum fructicola]|nr:hypothetical protein CGCFRS4_v012215 [Colletotrichum fructicola]
MKIKVRYVASGGTLYQNYTFDYTGLIEKNTGARTPPSLTIAADVLIRNLDYMEYHRPFNRPDDSGYETPQIVNGCIVRSHQTGDREKVFLCIAAFDQLSTHFPFKPATGFSQSRGVEPSRDYIVEWSQESLKVVEKGGRVSLTFAYVLGFGDSATTSMMSSETATEALGLLSRQFQGQSFTNNKHINLCLRRNLEYILSVCSVPVSKAGDQEPNAIALTCGDIDSHRIAPAASL